MTSTTPGGKRGNEFVWPQGELRAHPASDSIIINVALQGSLEKPRMTHDRRKEAVPSGQYVPPMTSGGSILLDRDNRFITCDSVQAPTDRYTSAHKAIQTKAVKDVDYVHCISVPR